MAVQWYPGHMAKAKRQIKEKLKLIDVVIELLDARIPLSSRNPMIDEIVGQKPRLILLNKNDLADGFIVKQWVEYFKAKGLDALPINSINGKGVSKSIIDRLEKLMIDKREAEKRKGLKPRAVRAMILGIPNVGKSSLINTLARKGATKTGDRPGVTKGQQWIKIGQSLELLDTPGILWPKFEDQEVGYRLAATGAIKDEIFHFDDIALFVTSYFRDIYPKRLMERYGLDVLPEDSVEIIQVIGKKRGAIMSGGIVDYDKSAEMILRELRTGKLGPFCLETPNNI